MIVYRKYAQNLTEPDICCVFSCFAVLYILLLYCLKKTLLILFCFIYFTSSVGVAVNLHYCGGKLKSISLTHSDEANCCGKKKMKKINCCKEKSVTYKVKDNQDSGNKSIAVQNPIKIIDTNYLSSLTNFVKINSGLSFVPDYGEPPDIDYGSTYLLNKVFRI